MQDAPVRHIGHADGDSIDMLLHHSGQTEKEAPWAHRFTHNAAYKLFWAITAVGLALGILLLFQVDVNTALGIPHLGTYIGILGTLFAIVYMVVDKKIVKNEEHAEAEQKVLSLKETLVHGAEDTAFVCTVGVRRIFCL